LKKIVAILQISSKLANSDVTKEALNCTASLLHLTALLTPLVSSVDDSVVLFCILKSSPQIWLQFRPYLSSKIRPGTGPAGFEIVKSGATYLNFHYKWHAGFVR